MLGKNRGKSRKIKTSKSTTPRNLEVSSEDQEVSRGLLLKLCYSVIPSKVGSELSFTKFATKVEPPLIHEVLKRKSTL